jgi:endoglucanase
MKTSVFFGLGLTGLLACSASMGQSSNIFERAKLLAKSVNFGNAFEAPKEGDWGLTLETSYFDAVKSAGFSAIRLPVRWNAHAAQTAPYTISPAFFARVDWAIQQATTRGLAVVVNIHHYDELIAEPAAHKARFLAIWQQVASRYAKQSNLVFFEVLNESNGKLEPFLNQYMQQAIATIRQSNPTRAIVVGGNGWNSIQGLYDLQLPNDPNLIGTFHFYSPFEFTHQGAEWVSPTPPVGVDWDPELFSWAGGWQNWSWESTLQPKPNGVFVTYNKGYGGVYLHNDAAVTGVIAVRFNTDKAINITVACLEKNNGGNIGGTSLQTINGQNTVTASACGSSNGVVRDLILMNNSANPQSGFQLSNLELQTTNGTVNLSSNAAQAINSQLERAANWSKTKQRPVWMGEFGAYSKANMAARVRWTDAVRQSAEALGIGWSYWEFGAGFGIYDPRSKQYRVELTKALLPNFSPKR